MVADLRSYVRDILGTQGQLPDERPTWTLFRAAVHFAGLVIPPLPLHFVLSVFRPRWHFKWALTQLHLRAKLPPSTNGKVRPAMDWLQLASTCNKIVYLFMCVRLYPIASDCLEHFSNEYVPSSRTSKRRPQFTKYIFPFGIIQSSQRSCHLSAWCVFKGVPFMRYWMHSPNIGAVSKHCLHVYPAHTVRTVTVISL